MAESALIRWLRTLKYQRVGDVVRLPSGGGFNVVTHEQLTLSEMQEFEIERNKKQKR